MHIFEIKEFQELNKVIFCNLTFSLLEFMNEEIFLKHWTDMYTDSGIALHSYINSKEIIPYQHDLWLPTSLPVPSHHLTWILCTAWEKYESSIVTYSLQKKKGRKGPLYVNKILTSVLSTTRNSSTYLWVWKTGFIF